MSMAQNIEQPESAPSISDEAKEALDELLEGVGPSGLSEDLYDTGICLVCGATRDGCEPDAEKYECYECGEHAVMGVETAIIAFC